jgi:Ring finger domain
MLTTTTRVLVMQVNLAKAYVLQHCDQQCNTEAAHSSAAVALLTDSTYSPTSTTSSVASIKTVMQSPIFSQGAVDLVIAAALQVSEQPVPAVVDDCAICMSQVTGDADAVSIDSCDHTYHLLCIAEWSKVTNNCPLCKRQYCKATRLRDGLVTSFQHRKQRHRGSAADDATAAAQMSYEDSSSSNEDSDDSVEDIVCMVRSIM